MSLSWAYNFSAELKVLCVTSDPLILRGNNCKNQPLQMKNVFIYVIFRFWFSGVIWNSLNKCFSLKFCWSPYTLARISSALSNLKLNTYFQQCFINFTALQFLLPQINNVSNIPDSDCFSVFTDSNFKDGLVF